MAFKGSIALTNDSLLKRILEDKAKMRIKLRDLPIEEKVKIIALMQRRDNEIRRATGRPATLEWDWSVVGGRPSLP